MLNKGFYANLVAFFIIILGLIFKNDILFTVGLFALSGSLTNSIAIHMLFEKVPFLYGSGVIEDKFEIFKLSIHSLIMEQFFTKENLKKFLNNELSDDKHFDFSSVIEKTDFTPAFISLKTAVMESSFGGMLGMFGGEKALDPLQESFTLKIKSAMDQIVHTHTFQNTLQEMLNKGDIGEDIINKIDKIVISRLDELTPKTVKDIVQNLIKEHLGWLVVWGAVFGGLIGFVGKLIF